MHDFYNFGLMEENEKYLCSKYWYMYVQYTCTIDFVIDQGGHKYSKFTIISIFLALLFQNMSKIVPHFTSIF